MISEAGKHGIKLILSLVNNYENMGGKKQYVEWARSQGQAISSEDDFFTNSVVKGFYKNHIKVTISEPGIIIGFYIVFLLLSLKLVDWVFENGLTLVEG